MARPNAERRPEATTPSDVPTALEEALQRVGDRWALLLVDALLQGARRFGELQESVPGIAPNILSDRLKRLEREGVVVSRRYSARPPRFTYELSAGGMDLAGALRLLAAWGSRRSPNAEHSRHQACGTPLETRWYCPTCARPVDDAETGDLSFA
jgi:DNA-binding HxlR family transcriptional regulator